MCANFIAKEFNEIELQKFKDELYLRCVVLERENEKLKDQIYKLGIKPI
jgi:hypothetical protein